MPSPMDPAGAVPAPQLEPRSFTDVPEIRKRVLDGVRQAYARRVVDGPTHRLEFVDVDYRSPKDYRLSEQKAALMNRRSLRWALQGRLRLTDKATGQVVSEDEAPRTLAHVPWLTPRGTFIHGGNEYVTATQMRLRPGAYTREMSNGDVETHVNVLPGSGRGFRINMAPATGVFRVTVGQSTAKLYPMMRALGYSDKDLEGVWGRELLNVNKAADDKTEGLTTKKIVARLGRPEDAETDAPEQRLVEVLQRMRLDPEVTRRTLGKAYDAVTPEVVLESTRKILAVSRKEAQADERDDLPYQSFHGPEDFFREHVEKDAGRLLRQALWKAKAGGVQRIPPGYFTRQMDSVLLGSGVAAAASEVNPLEILSLRHKLVRTGEGGIQDTVVVPKAARGVQPSHFGFIDPIIAPESQALGLDMRAAIGTRVGSDGRLYQQFFDPAGRPQWVSSAQAADTAVGLWDDRDSDRPKVRAMVGGRITYVPKATVGLWLPSPQQLFSPMTNLVPGLSGIKAQRASMGGRMQQQALPLKDAEAPLVRSAIRGTDRTFHDSLRQELGCVEADAAGTVEFVGPEEMVVRTADGRRTYDLYNNFPFNQKTGLQSLPLVKAGDTVRPGQLLARSNYTDDHGNIAMGRNLQAAYFMADGMTHEDAIVVSESASKKLASEQTYRFTHEPSDTSLPLTTADYLTKYPGKFTAAQLKTLDPTGVVQPGTIVRPGDPLVLAVSKVEPGVKGSVVRGIKSLVRDQTQTWDHEAPGEVVDVVASPRGTRVVVKSYTPSRVGDKLSNTYGGKGVIARVVPDDEMPQLNGQPLDVLMNPAGITSRGNPSALSEMLLGKIALKTGKPFTIDGFHKGSRAQYVLDQLRAHGLSDTETVIDPRSGRSIKDVFVGPAYVMKLHHLVESKMDARETGGYTMDDQPAKGVDTGSAKRLGGMEIAALVTHGVPSFLRESKLLRGQRNDDYWRLYRLGLNPPEPHVSAPYQKFEAMLRGAGVNLRKSGTRTTFLPMTDSDVRQLTGSREITEPDTVDFDSGEPVKGGLFDVGITGGRNGRHWAHIPLAAAVPNPVMEDPIRRLLGLTQKKYEAVIGGDDHLGGRTGGEAVRLALSRLDVPKEMDAAVEAIKSGRRTARDAAVKRLGVLKTLRDNDLRPDELVLSRLPVIPPAFRPIAKFEGRPLVADVNFLYKEAMEANANVRDSRDTFGRSGPQELQLYKAVKAVMGLGDPIGAETADRGVKGLLKHILGSSPKFGTFQHKTYSHPVDLVGRAVIVPEPSYDMDTIGLPVEQAWTLFKPFVIRKLVQSGMPAVEAVKAWKKRDPRATAKLLDEMETRPVVINRAPTLHKLSMTAHYAKPVAGNALRLPIPILSGLGADFDGDSLTTHVVVSDKAVAEAKDKMLPSRMLLHPRTYDVHMVPPHMFQAGLYAATTQASDKPVRKFRTAADVRRAVDRGELDVTDPVVVLEDG